MNSLTKETVDEILAAMDTFKGIAQELIGKLILETNQPEKSEIIKGNYNLISNEELLNSEEYLTDNWYFDVHGEHCMFENVETGQVLEVSLGRVDDIGNLDPYFFYNFLKSTKNLKHLASYFEDPFGEMLNLFEGLEQQKKLVHIHGVVYRKILQSEESCE
ncbi:hypothetical protein PAALTS15_15881 [Paenibacillus alvei TS-15]|uniref:DUF6896 domain-containing protein n=1 Tax=Paenibacillus alvei TS-15 TaxID=1117108 RepID=S9SND4_PAEAL|nr:hypothetical protein [Paenibacillus alvei]EPY06214.1 hypothetical protein PAALTS15_15881 [Paenibacillus alvei TS-15]